MIPTAKIIKPVRTIINAIRQLNPVLFMRYFLCLSLISGISFESE
jgi:hypothetical protein